MFVNFIMKINFEMPTTKKYTQGICIFNGD